MPETPFDRGLPTDPELRAIAREFLTALLSEMPFVATDLGIHTWDAAMPDLSPDGRQKWHETLARVRQKLADVDGRHLSRSDYADWVTLRNQAELSWDDATSWHPERRDPNWYNQVISESMMSLSRRQFGDVKTRAAHLINRLQQAPEFLQAAERLLDNPPKLFVEMAIQQFQAAVPMLEGLPASFSGIDGSLGLQMEQASRKLVEAYGRFSRFLQERWLSVASGDYRLGEQRYRERLGWQEGIEEPLPILLQRGYEELNRLRTLFSAAATEIDPNASAEELVERLATERPRPADVLDRVRAVLEDLRTFTEERQLLTLPQGAHPQVVETPAYLRMTTLASISPVGPFEEEATESYYQVTLPEPGASAADVHEQMAEFNPWTLRIISTHEVYPGHYAQFLWLPKARSTVRKILWSGAFVEGWAHYAEELMLEAGYGDRDPRMRLAQVQEALVRVGRFIVGIRLHVGDMTLEQAEQFFNKECMMTPKSAHREALRGTMDPFYLIYTLGKLEILRLRDAAEKTWGADYSLKTFHQCLLSHGAPTFPVLERLLFPGSEANV